MVRSKFDDKRAEITARFRTARTAEVADRDEISDFNREGGVPADFREAAGIAEPEPELPAEEAAPEPQPEPAPVAAPQTVRVKVRGQEMEVPLEEALGKARIAYAAEDYLDEAKGKLNEVNALLRQAKEQPARVGPNGQPQAAPLTAQPTEQPQPAPADLQPQESPFKKLVEAIQFGDPQEAEALFQNTLGAVAQNAVQQGLVGQRLRDEGARAMKTLNDFKDQNPELANDPMASAAIQAKIFELQVQDLQAIGVDPARIRPDGQSPTPGDIADAHKWYRSEGFSVRSPQIMLETARDNFLQWRGVKQEPTPDPAAAPAAKAAPRVVVNRDERRQAIQPQPSRTTAPREATPQPNQPRDRSDIVNSMKQQRAVKRGQTLGL